MVTVYVEGAGRDAAQKTRMRKAFQVMLERAGLEGRLPATVPSGPREKAFRDFQSALRNRIDGVQILLVDSEAPVTKPVWDHLRDRDGWTRPAGATDDQVHLMVQCMESWFLADPEALAAYYGAGFAATRLPGNANVEQIEKSQVESTLRSATRDTTKGPYHKTKHGFDLLGKLDPAKLEQVSEHAARFLDTLRRLCDIPTS